MVTIYIYIHTPLYGILNSKTQISDAKTTILLHFHGDSNSSALQQLRCLKKGGFVAYPGNMDIQKNPLRSWYPLVM